MELALIALEYLIVCTLAGGLARLVLSGTDSISLWETLLVGAASLFFARFLGGGLIAPVVAIALVYLLCRSRGDAVSLPRLRSEV